MGMKELVAKAKAASKYNQSLNGLALTADKIRYQLKTFSVVGASAVLDTIDEPAPSVSVGRIAAGAVIAGPVGAIIGGILKKDRSKGYIQITLADGTMLVSEFPSAKVSDARKLIALINEASEFYA